MDNSVEKGSVCYDFKQMPREWEICVVRKYPPFIGTKCVLLRLKPRTAGFCGVIFAVRGAYGFARCCMAELSHAIGMAVIDRSCGKLLGHIKTAYFDKFFKNIAYFAVSSENGELLLEPSNIAALKDAVMLDSAAALISFGDVDPTELRPCAPGTPVFTSAGASRGVVTEVGFQASGRLGKFSASEGEFYSSNILTAGDVIILKGVKPQKKPKPLSIPRPAAERTVFILDEAEERSGGSEAASEPSPEGKAFGAEAAISLNADSREPVFSRDAFERVLGDEQVLFDEDAHTPTRIISSYNFLLGRTLGADLTTYSGEPIAQKGSVVTASVVEQARFAGKLVELTLNSLREGEERP